MARNNVSRADRWNAATAEAREALESAQTAENAVTEAESRVEDAKSELEGAEGDAKTTLEAELEEAQEALTEAQEELTAAKEELADQLDTLEGIRGEYEEWRDNTPDSLQSTPTYDLLDTISNSSFDWSADGELDEAEIMLDEAEGMDLPRGFGRD